MTLLVSTNLHRNGMEQEASAAACSSKQVQAQPLSTHHKAAAQSKHRQDGVGTVLQLDRQLQSWLATFSAVYMAWWWTLTLWPSRTRLSTSEQQLPDGAISNILPGCPSVRLSAAHTSGQPCYKRMRTGRRSELILRSDNHPCTTPLEDALPPGSVNAGIRCLRHLPAVIDTQPLFGCRRPVTSGYVRLNQSDKQHRTDDNALLYEVHAVFTGYTGSAVVPQCIAAIWSTWFTLP